MPASALDAVDTTSRDVRNRAQGLAAELRGRVADQAPPDDDVLVERVRSQLGYAVRHPGSIEVSARGGRMTRSGPVLADEVDRLLRRVRRVRGVTSVDHRFEVYETPDGWMQRNWSPAARLIAAVGGCAKECAQSKVSNFAERQRP